MSITAGNFTIVGNMLSGPRKYMAERGDAKVQEALTGQSDSFEMMCRCAPQSCSIEQIFVIYLQTDYAAWKGEKQLLSMHRKPHKEATHDL